MSPNENTSSHAAEELRLACPVCHRVVLALPGNSAVRALEGHLELAHWFENKLAHDTANEALNNCSR